MGTAQKLGVLIIGVALVTTVSLPNRKFDQVVNAFTKFTTGVLSTAMGTARA